MSLSEKYLQPRSKKILRHVIVGINAIFFHPKFLIVMTQVSKQC